jgi:hypothetical protein
MNMVIILLEKNSTAMISDWKKGIVNQYYKCMQRIL